MKQEYLVEVSGANGVEVWHLPSASAARAVVDTEMHNGKPVRVYAVVLVFGVDADGTVTKAPQQLRASIERELGNG